MPRLILLGTLAAAFFSSTFILNRAMSLQGGHWFWSASLRYLWMLGLLVAGLQLSGHRSLLGAVWRMFCRHWRFWILAGSSGFGVFYTLLCFSSAYAPGWVVATTWQSTILASPLILFCFGRRLPSRALLFSGLIFAGVFLVNAEQSRSASAGDLFFGVAPVFVAAFAYPFGNQLVWEAQKGGRKWIPVIADPALNNPVARILLLSLGTIPFWFVLGPLVQPPPPSPDQWLNTALVALCSGIIATGLFLQARHLAEDAYQLSAVDATQSGEVVFSLLGELAFLGGVMPGWSGFCGILLTVAGLVFYLRNQAPRP